MRHHHRSSTRQAGFSPVFQDPHIQAEPANDEMPGMIGRVFTRCSEAVEKQGATMSFDVDVRADLRAAWERHGLKPSALIQATTAWEGGLAGLSRWPVPTPPSPSDARESKSTPQSPPGKCPRPEATPARVRIVGAPPAPRRGQYGVAAGGSRLEIPRCTRAARPLHRCGNAGHRGMVPPRHRAHRGASQIGHHRRVGRHLAAPPGDSPHQP